MQYRAMDAMIATFGPDVRRISHALKVHAFAMLIASGEAADNYTREVIGYTALLHDIGIHEAERNYHSTAGKYQQIEGPPIARRILSELGAPAKIIDRVCFITGNHHTYTRIDGIDFQIIVEADFLVNFFEDGMEQEAIGSVLKNVFKTESGKRLARSMFPG